ncbi:hypothetical protein Tco_0733876 [Tanacetum coccineum]|uniref:Retrotransposon protein, putative, Ty1-copia subclass n=1 Tax=Tanacetum coccineum TaxID=301880 RepID=A0ABQ4YI42_9ASTR
MNAEMKSIYDNKVWRLVVLPPNAKVVKSKWIYKKKTDMDGKQSYELTVIAMLDSKPIEIQLKSSNWYVFVLNGGAMVWKSSKQSTSAQHAKEAEYIAASESCKRSFLDKEVY